ncbi:MAG: alcohol dehydrogenase catalytic domain-containing protein [Bacillota bacterium]
MKALVYLGKNRAAVQEVAKPEVKAGQALVRVRLASICGSDLTIYHGKHMRARPPLIMGHESAGEVVEIGGGQECRFSQGDRVVIEPIVSCGRCWWCREGRYNLCPQMRAFGVDVPGAFAEYVVAPVERIHQVPDSVELRVGVLVEPAAVASHAVRTAGVKAGDTVAVIGGGPIGLLVALMARIEGASAVLVLEVKPFRLGIIEKLGFVAVPGCQEGLVEAVLDLTSGQGPDVVFDAAGSPEVAQIAIPMVKRGGTVTVIGVHKQPDLVDLRLVMYREIRMGGSFSCVAQDFERALQLFAGGKLDVTKKLITHIVPLEAGEKALRTADENPDAVKVVLEI